MGARDRRARACRTLGADRLHLPVAALGFAAIVSLMPGFFLFCTASALVAIVSRGADAPPESLLMVFNDRRHHAARSEAVSKRRR
jgi:hypothetical protein